MGQTGHEYMRCRDIVVIWCRLQYVIVPEAIVGRGKISLSRLLPVAAAYFLHCLLVSLLIRCALLRSSVLLLGCTSSATFIYRCLVIFRGHLRRHLCMILVDSAAKRCVPSSTSSCPAVMFSTTVASKTYSGTQDTLRHLTVLRSTA